MRYIIVPVWLVIVLGILAWAGVMYVYWFKPKIMPKLDDYFAHRRHLRRLYTTGKLFDINTTKVGGIPYARARHRR